MYIAHEIAYDHELVMAELQNEIWEIANKTNVSWEEAMTVWQDTQNIQFSDSIDDIPF